MTLPGGVDSVGDDEADNESENAGADRQADDQITVIVIVWLCAPKKHTSKCNLQLRTEFVHVTSFCGLISRFLFVFNDCKMATYLL